MVFDLQQYTKRQFVDALTCPINRHGTRVEHGCDDWALYEHPEWLMAHYFANGGPEAFAKRRDEFIRNIEVPDPPVQIEIEFFL
jgi:hypothetical protein